METNIVEKLLNPNNQQMQLQQTQHIEADESQTYLHNFCKTIITHLKEWICYPSK